MIVRPREGRRLVVRAALLWLGLLLGTVCLPAWGGEPEFDDRWLDVDPMREYGAGVRRHDLDGQTRVIGWRLNDRWYFGRRKGDDSDALGLIWQKGDTQFSISPEGIGWRYQFSQ
jgi:hypothetical protein